MPTRRAPLVLFLVIAVAFAALFVRLGVWQLSRMRQRRALNAHVAERLAAPPSSWRAVPADTGAAHYRRVRVEGRLDYAREIVLANRSRDGSPGVNVLTPVRVAGTDTLVLVNRGWVYSPNGTDVDLASWRDASGDTLAADGWVEIPSRQRGPARLSAARAFRWLDPAGLARDLGAPVTPFYVVLEPPPGDPPAGRPVRLPAPSLDEGPHRSYAFQWFAFALVTLGGAAAFAAKSRDPRPGPPPRV
jgi:surfeit locus 1 family protein